MGGRAGRVSRTRRASRKSRTRKTLPKRLVAWSKGLTIYAAKRKLHRVDAAKPFARSAEWAAIKRRLGSRSRSSRRSRR